MISGWKCRRIGRPPASLSRQITSVLFSRILRQRDVRRPEDLASEVLIHDLSMEGHAGFPSWDVWLRKAGITDPVTTRGMKINNSAAVLQAAAEGQGVALARSVMARDDLASGRLVRLFPELSSASPLAYCVVYRGECSNLPRLVAFRDWLFEEATGELPITGIES